MSIAGVLPRIPLFGERMVSVPWHLEQLSVDEMRIACSLALVGRMSCIALYHLAFMDSGAGVAHKFFQTVSQRVAVHIRSIHILSHDIPAWNIVSCVE
jgi:hypothetical protein